MKHATLSLLIDHGFICESRRNIIQVQIQTDRVDNIGKFKKKEIESIAPQNEETYSRQATISHWKLSKN